MANLGFPTEFIEEVKQRNDIVSTMSKSVTLQKKGKTYWTCCPFHFEKTPSMAVNENEQFYHCFGCGESGDVIKFVQKYENLSFYEAVKLLAESAGMELPELKSNEQDLEKLRTKEKILKALNSANDYYIDMLSKDNRSVIAREYLEKRELNDEVVKYFKIGFSPDWNGLIKKLESEHFSLDILKQAGLIEVNEQNRAYDVFATRLTFPILNAFGDCIGFTARTLEKDSKFAKYRNSTQTMVFDKSRTIYNINTIKNLRKEKNIDYIIICEGTIDVIAMYKAGFKNTVACMGTAITGFHAKELKKYTDKIVICLDGDSAGQNATYKAIDVFLEAGLEVRVVKLKENLDPDEYLKKYGKDDLRENLNNALDAIEYKIESLSLKYNLNDNYQKNRFVSQAIEILNTLDSNAEKEIYLKIVAHKTDISVDVLRRDLTKPEFKTEEKPSEENNNSGLVVRPDGHIKAVKFVLASIIHKQDYALEALNRNLMFKNPNYQKLFDFAKNCLEHNKTNTISSLFDYFDVENNEDIGEIINYNFSVFNDNKKTYFDECLEKIVLVELKAKQEELMNEFKNEKDNNKRREIAVKLGNLAKEIKNGDK